MRKSVSLSFLEYLAAGYIVGIGLWVLSWGPDKALSAPAFEYLKSNLSLIGKPHVTFGLLAIFLGLFHMIAVNVNGRGMHWTPLVRAFSCVVVTTFTLNFSLSVAQIQPSSTAVFTYGFVTVIYSLLFLANLERTALAIEMLWRKAFGLDT